jgi:hypothetical protein
MRLSTQPLFFYLILSTSLIAGSAFESLESEFARAVPADPQTAAGYWAGNCTEASEPDAFWPAILVVRQTPSSKSSLSYYWERSSSRDHFRNMKPQELEKHSGLKRWLANEKWSEASTKNGSFSNTYSPDPNTRVRRELRHTGSEFDSRYLLRVLRVNGLLESVTTYCEFDQHQGLYRQILSLPFGQTGQVGSEVVSIRNQNSTVDIERLEFENEGNSTVVIKNMRVVAANGSVTRGPTELVLPPKNPTVLERTPAGPNRIIRLEFNVVGVTSGISVRFYSPQ